MSNEYGLSPREIDTLNVMANGIITNRGLAERLKVGEKTAGMYVSNIMSKLEDALQQRMTRQEVANWWREQEKAIS